MNDEKLLMVLTMLKIRFKYLLLSLKYKLFVISDGPSAYKIANDINKFNHDHDCDIFYGITRFKNKFECIVVDFLEGTANIIDLRTKFTDSEKSTFLKAAKNKYLKRKNVNNVRILFAKEAHKTPDSLLTCTIDD